MFGHFGRQFDGIDGAAERLAQVAAAIARGGPEFENAGPFGNPPQEACQRIVAFRFDVSLVMQGARLSRRGKRIIYRIGVETNNSPPRVDLPVPDGQLLMLVKSGVSCQVTRTWPD